MGILDWTCLVTLPDMNAIVYYITILSFVLLLRVCDVQYLPLGRHMRQLCAVPELLLTSTDLLTLLAKPMYDTLKALCLNRH